MTVRPSSDTGRYTRTAMVLHWLIAAAVFAQIWLGMWMVEIPKSPPGVRAYWFNIHKSIGITIGVLVVVRLLWRVAHRPPELPDTLARWQRSAARVSHYLLYACLIVLPLSGYLGSNFTRYPIKYFGYTLPHWGWESPVLKEIMSELHAYAASLFVTLILLHIAAALKHRFVDKDGVFERMLPARKSTCSAGGDSSSPARRPA